MSSVPTVMLYYLKTFCAPTPTEDCTPIVNKNQSLFILSLLYKKDKKDFIALKLYKRYKNNETGLFVCCVDDVGAGRVEITDCSIVIF